MRRKDSRFCTSASRQLFRLGYWSFMLGGFLVPNPPSFGQTATEILHTILENRQNLPARSLSINLRKEQIGGNANGQTTEVHTELRRSGDRYDVTTVINRTNREGQSRRPLHQRYFWDGKREFASKKVGDGGYKAQLYSERNNVSMLTKVPFLMGVLDYSGSHFAEVLLKSGSLSVRSGKEEVDGIPCLVLEGEVQQGDDYLYPGVSTRYTIWLDGEKGYLFRKAVVDIPFESPIPMDGKQAVSQRHEIDGVRIEEVDGIPVITAAKKKVRTTYSTGDFVEYQQEGVITSLEWNPDLESLGAFQIDLPEGTVVSDRDAGFNCVWREGRLEPLVNKAALNSIAETIEEIAASRSPVFEGMTDQRQSSGVSTKETSRALSSSEEPSESWVLPLAIIGVALLVLGFLPFSPLRRLLHRHG